MFRDTIIHEICERLKQIDEKRLFKIILNNEQFKDLIIELNTDVQLRQQHIDSLGNKLFNQYTGRDFYGAGDELGRDGEPYEVYNSGAYFDSFKIEIEEGYILIESNPIKGQDSLFEMYTEDIEGLTEDSLIKLQELAKELYVNWIERNIMAQ